jgi:hypothetical protein
MKKPKEPKPKSLEARLRATLRRRGYRLIKSRRRDPVALDFGGYMIVDSQGGFAVEGGGGNTTFRNGYDLSLYDVQAWVAGMKEADATAPKAIKRAKATKRLRSARRG